MRAHGAGRPSQPRAPGARPRAQRTARRHAAALANARPVLDPRPRPEDPLAKPGAFAQADLGAPILDRALGREVERIDQADPPSSRPRSRAVACSGIAQSCTDLASALDGLVDASSLVHSDRRHRGRPFHRAGPGAGIDRQALDVLLGNLLDACRAGRGVRPRSRCPPTPGAAQITIADDGPGIPPRAPALLLGRRLDEERATATLPAIVREPAGFMAVPACA